MNLSNMFPASGGLAAQVKKPVATAVAKPTENKAVGSSLADCMQTRKRPGEWAIKWPKLRKQGFKDYRPLLTIQEVIDYCNRCEETGLGGFDYETSGDKDHRIPPTDEDGNTVTGKALDSWTRDVNLDPWKAEVCAMSLSAACDEARAIFIDNPGANQFEPGLSRSEARKRLFDTLEQYFFTNHKIIKIAVNMNFETKFTAKYGKYILMPCADPFIAWIRLSQLLLPNKIKNPKRPYVGKGLKPMTKEVFGVQMSEFTSVLERNQALFFDQVPNDEHDALSYCCEDSDYAVQHYLYWDEVAKQISNDNEVYPTYSDWLKNIEMPFTRVTGIMEYWGMKWDSDIAQVKREEAKNAIEIAAQTMKDLAASVGIKDLNVGVGGKTKDVKSFVFDTLKLPAAAWSDKTKDPSLDSNALMDMIFMLENKLEDPDEEKYLETPLPEEWEMVDPDLSYQDQRLLWPREYTTAEVKRIRIARREEHPYKDIGIKFLKSMQTIQKYATLLSSHVEGREKYVNPVTGRIHAKYEPWTETARLASNSPNGQNVPRPDNDELGVRNFYKAEPGKVFLLEDESGFELRLTAWKSGCEVMRKEGVNTMGYSRQAVADLVNSWVGKNEADGSYKTIIEIYNSYKGTFPRGTKMDYSWPWCACTWSAAAIKLGYTPIMPIEISCYYLIEAAKKKGIWIENDAHVPKVGEGVLYYWKDGMNFATTDCTGVPDHVGTVTEVYEKAGYFVVTEGNYSNAVKKRTLLINGRYIRGFISPKYTDDTVTPVTPAAGKDLTTVAREVILGVWGNMPERKTKLEASGYNFTDVQNKVNELLNKNVPTPSKPQNTGVTKVVAGSGAASFDKSLAGSYVTTTGLYMRHGAGKNKRAMVLIPEGTKVQNYGYYTSYNGTKWLYIQVTLNGVQYTGFSSKTYLKKQ